MNVVFHAWHRFLQTRAGYFVLIFLLVFALFVATLSAMRVWQLGTFEGWLTLLTAITGLGYATYYLRLGKGISNISSDAVNEGEDRAEGRKSYGFLQKIITTMSDFTAGIFPILFLVLLLRSFLFEPFRIPSGSMLPTLHLGDFIIVNKYSYGLKLPIWGTQILSVGQPQRGDVVVFRFPKDESVDYIKRIVGLPGDVVTIVNNEVRVNNQPLKKIDKGVYKGKQWQYIGGVAREYEERNVGMLDDKDYSILWDINGSPLYDQVYRVPEGHYFVMGDNRSNSNDSRYWGWVPVKNIKGRASYVWLNWYDEFNWSRIGLPL